MADAPLVAGPACLGTARQRRLAMASLLLLLLRSCGIRHNHDGLPQLRVQSPVEVLVLVSALPLTLAFLAQLGDGIVLQCEFPPLGRRCFCQRLVLLGYDLILRLQE